MTCKGYQIMKPEITIEYHEDVEYLEDDQVLIFLGTRKIFDQDVEYIEDCFEECVDEVISVINQEYNMNLHCTISKTNITVINTDEENLELPISSFRIENFINILVNVCEKYEIRVQKDYIGLENDIENTYIEQEEETPIQ